MMTMSKTLITSRDPKGRQFMSIVEAAYDQARLDHETAQLLNERGNQLKAGVSELIARLRIKDESVEPQVAEPRPDYDYRSHYRPKSLEEQVDRLRELFPHLGPADLSAADCELP